MKRMKTAARTRPEAERRPLHREMRWRAAACMLGAVLSVPSGRRSAAAQDAAGAGFEQAVQDLSGRAALAAGAGVGAPSAVVPALAEAAPAAGSAAGGGSPSFKKVMIVVLENASYSEALAQPFLSSLAKQGALLTDFSAESHPSQPNYLALVAGTDAGVTSDKPVTLNERHIGDLLEAQGKTWKVYAQAYPGNCFLGAQSGNYVRKHVPLLSFNDVQTDPRRCADIVDDSSFQADASGGRMPDFSLFIPDVNNDGHQTGVAYADRWLSGFLPPLMRDKNFMKDMLVVVTFDEDDKSEGNRIYAALFGDSVVPGAASGDSYNHYSLLRTVEDALGLGTLGQNDDSSSPISGVWR